MPGSHCDAVAQRGGVNCALSLPRLIIPTSCPAAPFSDSAITRAGPGGATLQSSGGGPRGNCGWAPRPSLPSPGSLRGGAPRLGPLRSSGQMGCAFLAAAGAAAAGAAAAGGGSCCCQTSSCRRRRRAATVFTTSRRRFGPRLHFDAVICLSPHFTFRLTRHLARLALTPSTGARRRGLAGNGCGGV